MIPVHPPYHKLEEGLVVISQKFLIEDAEDLGRSRGGCLSWCSCFPPETGTPMGRLHPTEMPGTALLGAARRGWPLGLLRHCPEVLGL